MATERECVTHHNACDCREAQHRRQVEELREAIEDIYRSWCDDDILTEHGIDEGFGMLIVSAAMRAGVYPDGRE